MSSASSLRATATDASSSVPRVLAWFVGVTNVLCIIVKFAMKFMSSQRIDSHDIMVGVSLVFSIGMIVAVSEASQNGLGKHLKTLASSQIDAFEKCIYAVDALYILTLFFSKFSVLAMLTAITPVKSHLIYIGGAKIVLAAYMLTSFVASIFQCQLPQTWRRLSQNCFNQQAFWSYFAAMNVFTEILLCAPPAVVIQKLQMTAANKWAAVLPFVSRSILVAPIAAELFFRQRVAGNPSDSTFQLWTVVVCLLVTQCLSLVFACMLPLRPLLASFETGMMRLDNVERRDSGITVSNRSEVENGKQGHGSDKGRNTIHTCKDMDTNNYGYVIGRDLSMT